MGVCNCSMCCCSLLYVHSIIASILMGKRELVSLLNLSSWCLVMVEWLFPSVPWGCLLFVVVVFPDNTHLLLLNMGRTYNSMFNPITFNCDLDLEFAWLSHGNPSRGLNRYGAFTQNSIICDFHPEFEFA